MSQFNRYYNLLAQLYQTIACDCDGGSDCFASNLISFDDETCFINPTLASVCGYAVSFPANSLVGTSGVAVKVETISYVSYFKGELYSFRKH